jgi:hypothetical protein
MSIVGTDEVDLNRNHISWVSPLGRVWLKSAPGAALFSRPRVRTSCERTLGVRSTIAPIPSQERSSVRSQCLALV